MRLPGRLSAAIDVLTDVENRKRPVSEALKSWGLANRFAGAGDRAAIGNLVYDALRRRASHAHLLGATPRALVLAVAVRDWAQTPADLNASFEGDAHAPAPLTDDEIARLAGDQIADAPEHVQADIPEWLAPSLARAFPQTWIAEGQAMTGRPSLDLRVNTLKSTAERALKSLKRFEPQQTAIAPNGITMPAGSGDSRTPNVQTDEGYLKGWFEVQDQGSQIVAALIGAKPGEQALDLCAGAGGKTLSIAAAMENKGQIFAYDSDRARLAPIYDRLKRNGVRNVQVRSPQPDALADLVGKMDRVLIDAPCTGTGTWRRRPDTKWKLTPELLATRVAEQAALLAEAVQYVKPGGVLVYITCSILPEENDDQIATFLTAHPEFKLADATEIWKSAFGDTAPDGVITPSGAFTLTPRLTQTDGFYCAVLLRART